MKEIDFKELDKQFKALEYTTYRWVNYKEITNSQGTFKISWRNEDHWEPSDSVAINTEGVIVWVIDNPSGVLAKYPDGTKRFIKTEL